MKTQQEVIDNLTTQAMDVLRTREDSFVQELLNAYKVGGKEILGRITQVYRELGADGWNYAVAHRSGRLVSMLADINQTITRLTQESIRITGSGMVDQYQESALRSSWLLDQATPPNVSVSIPDLAAPSVQAAVAEPFEGAMFSQRLGHISDLMADDIKNGITQSLLSGESMSDAADRVDEIIGDEDGGSAYRSMVIAQTEIMRAQNLGREATFGENDGLMSGDPTVIVTPDDRLCPWCLRCEGLTGTEMAELPAKMGKKEDPTAGTSKLPKHPKCRCTWAPQLKTWGDLIGVDMPEDFGPEERGMRNDDGKWVYAPVQKFDDWLAATSADAGLT